MNLRVAFLSFFMSAIAILSIQAQARTAPTPDSLKASLERYYEMQTYDGEFRHALSQDLIHAGVLAEPEFLPVLVENIRQLKDMDYQKHNMIIAASVDALAIYHVQRESSEEEKRESSAAVHELAQTPGDLRYVSHHVVLNAVMDYFGIHPYKPALPMILAVIETNLLPSNGDGRDIHSYEAWWALANAADLLPNFRVYDDFDPTMNVVTINTFAERARENVYTGRGLTPDHMAPLLTRVLRGQAGGKELAAEWLKEIFYSQRANDWMVYTPYFKAESIVLSIGALKHNDSGLADITRIFEANPSGMELTGTRNVGIARFARSCMSGGDCDVLSYQPIRGMFGKIYGIHASFYEPSWQGSDTGLGGSVAPEFPDTWVEHYGVTKESVVNKWREQVRAKIGNR